MNDETTAAKKTKLLAIDNLTVRIPLPGGAQVHAATNINLDVNRGEIVAVIGESGCGKSIVASAVAGILPPHAKTSGAVHYYFPDGQAVDILARRSRTAKLAQTDRELAGKHIALIPQSAATFLTPVRTIGAQLTETISVLGSEYSSSELLQRVRLDPEVGTLYPHEISGGMAQRAAVAFALVGNPDLIIADEPTASLDPELTMNLLAMLHEIATEGVGVMLITHDITELRDSGIADRIAVMYASRFEETGTAEQVLRAPKSAYMRDLLAALPENGLHPMPGTIPSLTNLPEDYCYERRLEVSHG
ncbi:ATP-binding cassette domain-containing protein [Corynebacterium pseudodiphtheriticum]|uniref:ATP-binding cassette domain-containing protein n=1 Tax=Corynebacterium pseudodiphtheriticum TaxID=37637 RepID=UPI0020C038CC|nr:ABC transporter ATP-binding protein [Corynebacterium pseudodiphtheriticum]UQV56131.1 ABC transporter ATP-binding protein [Corynebacterium pseudodiphtheriticum]